MESKKSIARTSFAVRFAAILLLWIMVYGWVSLVN